MKCAHFQKIGIFLENLMETVVRHCYVMTPNEYAKTGNESDDVFLCEYEYDVKYHSFKRIAELLTSITMKRMRKKPSMMKIGVVMRIQSLSQMMMMKWSMKKSRSLSQCLDHPFFMKWLQ